MKMNRFLTCGLLFSGTVFGASMSGEKSEVDISAEPQTITFTTIATLRKNLAREVQGAREVIIHLDDLDPFARRSYRELRQRSFDINMPWIVGDVASAGRIDVIRDAEWNIRCFDVQALLEERIRQHKTIDLSSIDALYETLRKALAKKVGRLKIFEWSVHIFDRENRHVSYFEKYDEEYVPAQLRYVLQNDLAALKKMITIWSSYSFAGMGPYPAFVFNTQRHAYTDSWCAEYLKHEPYDAKILRHVEAMRRVRELDRQERGDDGNGNS